MNNLKHNKIVSYPKGMTTIILETEDGSVGTFQIGDQTFIGGSKVEWTNWANTITVSENVDVKCSVPFNAKSEVRDLTQEMPLRIRKVV